MRVVSTRQIEMLWRCSVCQREIPGRHLNCTGCGKAKTTEQYYMPGDTASAPSITEPELLRVAHAGPNWSCSYCGGDQRRLDGSCANCGGPRASQLRRPRPKEFEPAVFPADPWYRHPLTLVGSVVLFFVALFAWCNRTREYEAEVLSVAWKQSIVVERYQVWSHEDWRSDTPSSAFDVVSLGSRVHHYDEVLDGYHTEYYTVRVPCGESCTPVPEYCSESCSPNGNGFATCRTTCSGGGESCSTRYCDESRTRQVPSYHQEPRYADYVRYHIWEWGHHRTVNVTGTKVSDLRWPVEEARVGEGLAQGEKEREHREGLYSVTLGYDEDEQICVAVSESSFASFDIGTPHHLTIKGSSTKVDGVEVREVE